MTQTEKLNQKLQQLLELTAEVNELIPNFVFPNDWDEVFGEISNLNHVFRNVSTDMCVDKFHDVELVITGKGTKNDFEFLLGDLQDEYSEFMPTMSPFISQMPDGYMKFDCMGYWTGNTYDFELLPEAAFFLSDTNIEDMHIEVCVDGVWFGRENKDIER